MRKNPGSLTDDSGNPDEVVDVAMILLVKQIVENNDGELFLVGSIIQRLVNPPPGLKYFVMRINEQPSRNSIEIRRTRPAQTDLKHKDGSHGVVSTFNVVLPLKCKADTGVEYPFGILDVFLTIELSATAINNTQCPSIDLVLCFQLKRKITTTS